MKRNIFLFVILNITLLSCEKNNKHLEVSNKLFDDYKNLERNNDSLLIINSELIKLNDSLQQQIEILKKGSSHNNNSISTKYGYIRDYKNKYPADVNLYDKGTLKTELLKLLGSDNFEKFKSNMGVQGPINIINNEYVFLTGNAPHSGGFNEAGLLIDLINDQISVGILVEGKEVLYYTEKKDKRLKRTSGEINGWLYRAHEKAGLKMSERD